MSRFLPALALAAAAMLLPAAAQANLVTNGNFASPCGSGSFCTYGAGDPNVTGWTISNNGVDLITGYWSPPNPGENTIDISALSNGTLSQSLTTEIGKSYTLSFMMAGNPDGGPTVKSMDVSLGGVGVTNFTFDTTGHSKSSMGWTLETLTFVATSTSTLLEFIGNDATAFGAAIAEVSVEAVPEPASLALLGGGLLTFAAMRRRRSKSETKA